MMMLLERYYLMFFGEKQRDMAEDIKCQYLDIPMTRMRY
ncbi:MAG: hypothetical protein UW91_C0022G0002 [Parcubacteria group bacterium GW2011_GWF2_45_11]|nr:MAG: hypothetical protein UW91_C0022G0002 [Parcubacteria group bacterium GW2011_GWF2_45_11]